MCVLTLAWGLSGPRQTLEGSSSQPRLPLHPTAKWAELAGYSSDGFPPALGPWPRAWPRADETEDNSELNGRTEDLLESRDDVLFSLCFEVNWFFLLVVVNSYFAYCFLWWLLLLSLEEICHCNRLNICVSPGVIGWNPGPHWDGTRVWPRRGSWVMRAEPSKWVCVLWKRPQEELSHALSALCVPNKKAICSPAGMLRRNPPCWNPGLSLPASKHVGNASYLEDQTKMNTNFHLPYVGYENSMTLKLYLIQSKT